MCAMKTGPKSQKQRMFQEEDGFDFRDAATRLLISAELRRFSLDSVTVHPPISRRCVASANPWREETLFTAFGCRLYMQFVASHSRTNDRHVTMHMSCQRQSRQNQQKQQQQHAPRPLRLKEPHKRRSTSVFFFVLTVVKHVFGSADTTCSQFLCRRSRASRGVNRSSARDVPRRTSGRRGLHRSYTSGVLYRTFASLGVRRGSTSGVLCQEYFAPAPGVAYAPQQRLCAECPQSRVCSSMR